MAEERYVHITTEVLDEGTVKFTVPAKLLLDCRPTVTVTEMEDITDHHKTYIVQIFLEEITGPIPITEEDPNA